MSLLSKISTNAPGILFPKRSIGIWRLNLVTNANIHNLNSPKKLLAPNLKIFPKRTFFGFRKKPSAEELKIRDNVPDEYTMIYKDSKMGKYLVASQICTSLAAAIVVITGFVFYDYTFDLGQTKTNKMQTEIMIYCTVFFTAVLVVQLMVTKIPVRIYNLPQQNNYILMFNGNLPFTTKKVTCRGGELKKLKEGGILPWNNTKYSIRNEHSIILLDQHFRRPADLYVMLGQQKHVNLD